MLTLAFEYWFCVRYKINKDSPIAQSRVIQSFLLEMDWIEFAIAIASIGNKPNHTHCDCDQRNQSCRRIKIRNNIMNRYGGRSQYDEVRVAISSAAGQLSW